MPDPIGAVGLAIAAVDTTIKVVLFVRNCVDSAKQYGEDVRMMRKQHASESVRCQMFAHFLKRKMSNGKTRFEMLPKTHQNTIVGMTEELEISIFSYSEVIKKYKLEDLQRGYELEPGPSFEPPLVGETVAKAAIERSKAIQQKTKKIDKAIWGLFREKKISSLIMTLELWNNKLMNFLLCGIYFLEHPDDWIAEDKETV